ncbi:MAG: Rrf2 family transcriptional regulator [Acidimicrobiia bacterium]|nr:Rrf2 family transcriptional regulator [Acidimicrobiia bacterium]
MRLELTRKTDLALRALRALAASPGRLAGPVLAEAVGTTVPFIAQVMSPMVRAGLVTSRPGPNGGYTLASGAEEASVLQVIEAVEGPIDPHRCVLAGGPCGEDVCAVHDAWQVARAALEAALASARALD